MRTFDYQQAFGAWDKTTDAMASAVEEWFSLYYNSRPTKTSDPCQRIAYTVVHKLVRAMFSEYTAHCPEGFYSRVLASLDSYARKAVQLALVGGECYIKPCPGPAGFDFTLIPRNNILVFGRDSDGELTDVGLVEKTVRGRYYYTLLERRSVSEQGYLTIENRLYRSLNTDSLGQPVPLTDHPLYAHLTPESTFPEPLGGVGLVRLKTPLLNCVDGSADGVSVYAAACELIRRIDENEAQLRGEFSRGESRIITSRDLLDENDGLTDNLFVGLDEDVEQVGLHIFSPQLREQSFLARKLEYLRNVESVIGLQRGMLGDVNAMKRTATEVSASEGEYSLTVIDFQKMWRDCLLKTMALCARLANAYGMDGSPLPQITVDWGNGVLYDEDKLWEDYKSMVAMGLIAPEVALGWRFGLPVETEADRAAIRRRFMPAGTE